MEKSPGASQRASGHGHRQWAVQVCLQLSFTESALVAVMAPPSTCWRGESVTVRPTSLSLRLGLREEVLKWCG